METKQQQKSWSIVLQNSFNIPPSHFFFHQRLTRKKNFSHSVMLMRKKMSSGSSPVMRFLLCYSNGICMTEAGRLWYSDILSFMQMPWNVIRMPLAKRGYYTHVVTYKQKVRFISQPLFVCAGRCRLNNESDWMYMHPSISLFCVLLRDRYKTM